MGNQSSSGAGDGLEGRDVRQLDQRVSAALARGVKYNMKILIRGERHAGKTQLLRRLQGLEFDTNYVATPEITTAHMIWNCSETDENVKVEFWDVVDKGIQPQSVFAGVTSGSGDVNEKEIQNVVLLDASTINVYRGCDGVIVCYDPTSPKSLAYVKSIIEEVEVDIPILICVTFTDKRKEHKLPEEVEELTEQRDKCCAIQVCSKDSFGIDEVRRFLSVPFMCLKQRYAVRQLKHCKEQIEATRLKLDSFLDTFNYDVHCRQWNMGGAQIAMQQAARIQALQQEAAADKNADQATPKAKMVPIEKLILPPRIDANAPDLGREVASFSTGKIDESFFSSDDEVQQHVQVLGLDSDEDGEENTRGLGEGEGSELSEEEAEAKENVKVGKVVAAAAATATTTAAINNVLEEEPKKEQAATHHRKHDEDDEEALARQKEREQRQRLEEMKKQQDAKKKAEEERLAGEMQSMDAGALDDGFLSDSDEEKDSEYGDEVGWNEGSEQAPQTREGAAGKGTTSTGKTNGGEKSRETKKSKHESSDSDSDERPHIMGDEDLSD